MSVDKSNPWNPTESSTQETADSSGDTFGTDSKDTDTETDVGEGFGRPRSSLKDRLFSTTPQVDVETAAREFQTGVKWEGHLSAGIQKITGSEGTTAIEHLLLATFLFLRANRQQIADRTQSAENPDDGDSQRRETDGRDGSETTATVDASRADIL